MQPLELVFLTLCIKHPNEILGSSICFQLASLLVTQMIHLRKQPIRHQHNLIIQVLLHCVISCGLGLIRSRVTMPMEIKSMPILQSDTNFPGVPNLRNSIQSNVSGYLFQSSSTMPEIAYVLSESLRPKLSSEQVQHIKGV